MSFFYGRGSSWIGHVIPDVHERLVPPRILEKFTPKKVKRGSSITFSVKVEGEAALLERLTATYYLSLGAGPVPGGVLSLSGLDSLPSVPQDTQPPLCTGSRRRQRRECCGLAPKPLATPWPALPSSIAWSCWTWAESTRAPTRALLPTLPARRSALPACTSLAVSKGSGGRQVHINGRGPRAGQCRLTDFLGHVDVQCLYFSSFYGIRTPLEHVQPHGCRGVWCEVSESLRSSTRLALYVGTGL